MTAVGIDFGTTNCVVAKHSENGVEVLKIDHPKDGAWVTMGFDRILPSVFGMGPDREPLFGWRVKDDPDIPRAEAVKRLLATEETVQVGSESMYVDEIVALFFAHMNRAAAEQGVDFDQAVVTVPANSKGPARARTKICAGIAGIDVLTLINEPTAAAMAYGLQANSDQTVLIVDFGGGTLDVTLLEAVDGVFMEQASKGIAKLGGLNFDEKLRAKILERVPDHQTWSQSQNREFSLEVEKAKIRLSSDDETTVQLPSGEVQRVTGRMFEDVVGPLIQRVRDPIERCLSDMGTAASSVNALVMVGGTSKIPAVRAFVSELLQQEPVAGIDPMTAVGEGAAIAAAIMTGSLQTSDFFVSLEHGLGTAILTQSGQLRFSEIIKRGRKLPAEGTNMYRPVVDNQETLIVRVLEGDEENPLNDQDFVLAWEHEVALPEPRPIEEVSLEMTYRYDLDGIIHVTLLDVERSIKIIDDQQIGGGITSDGRALVQMAGRVNAAIDGGTVEQHTPAARLEDPEANRLVEQARSKVIPFLDDAQALAVQALAEQVEQSQNGDLESAKQALETELRKYSYLL